MLSFFDRLRAGWTAGKSCFEVLRNDKRLIVFPILSGLSALVVLLSFGIPLAIIKPAFLSAVMDERHVDLQHTPIWFWIVAFLFYFCNYFVIYFFNAALVHCAISHFRREPVPPSEGLRAAGRRFPELLAWAFVSATVGLILKLIENANEKIGSFVSAILGSAWTVVTYFVVPVLVVERVGPMQAIQRSWQILRKTWGESIGGHIGVGWALLPFWLLGVLVAVLGALAMMKSAVLGVALVAIAILYFLALGLVDATLKGILLGALYLYSTNGEVPEEFERGALDQSFTPKK
jgi:Family of unknown function (DUF6159)